MPSEKVLEQKKQAVSEIVDKLNASVAGVVVEYKGINVADDTALRSELRDADVDYSVVKNTLLRRAADDAGLSEMKDAFVGTTAVAISKDDRAAAARILKKFAKKHDGFEMKAGYLDGKVIDLDMLNQLADLPTLEVLLATVCSAFNAPIASFARVIQAVADKKTEEGETAEAPAEQAEEAAAKTEEAPAAAEAAPEAPAAE